MKLYIKERLFAWNETYDVYDELGDCIYKGLSDLSTFGHKINVYNASDVIGHIEQKLYTELPKFELYLHNEYIGELTKQFTYFKPYYTIDGLNWSVKGDFFAHDYTVYDENENEVFSIYREISILGDSYCVNITKNEYLEKALIVSIAIDAASCEE